jgi:hypothetical protein
MLENRIRNLSLPDDAPAWVGFQPAFVACPVPLFATFSTMQQAFVAEVYRRAQELVEAQQRPAPSRIPAFSLN